MEELLPCRFAVLDVKPQIGSPKRIVIALRSSLHRQSTAGWRVIWPVVHCKEAVTHTVSKEDTAATPKYEQQNVVNESPPLDRRAVLMLPFHAVYCAYSPR